MSSDIGTTPDTTSDGCSTCFVPALMTRLSALTKINRRYEFWSATFKSVLP